MDGLAAKGAGKPVESTADDATLYEAAREIFERVYARRVRVREIVISAQRIEPAPAQRELFTGEREAEAERRGKLCAALDKLRTAYPGRAAPAFGKALAAAERTPARLGPVTTHRSGPSTPMTVKY